MNAAIAAYGSMQYKSWPMIEPGTFCTESRHSTDLVWRTVIPLLIVQLHLAENMHSSADYTFVQCCIKPLYSSATVRCFVAAQGSTRENIFST